MQPGLLLLSTLLSIFGVSFILEEGLFECPLLADLAVVLALLEYVGCEGVDRGHQLFEELSRLLFLLLVEGFAAVTRAYLRDLVHPDAVLVVRHDWLVLEQVLDVLERGELRTSLLDNSLLSQLLLLLLEDRLELLSD